MSDPLRMGLPCNFQLLYVVSTLYITKKYYDEWMLVYVHPLINAHMIEITCIANFQDLSHSCVTLHAVCTYTGART